MLARKWSESKSPSLCISANVSRSSALPLSEGKLCAFESGLPVSIRRRGQNLCELPGPVVEFPLRLPSTYRKQSSYNDFLGFIADGKPMAHSSATPPDISAGLGRQRAKRDIVALEEFIVGELLIRNFSGRLCLYEPPAWKELDKDSAEMKIRSCLNKFGVADTLTEKEYNELFRLLRINETIRAERPKAPLGQYLNLADGTMDIITGKLLPHEPDDGFFTYLNIKFDELRMANAGHYFESFVACAGCGNSDVRQQILELIGLAITGFPIKHFYVLLGPSGSGKTQLGRFLRELIGPELVESVRDIGDFGGRFTTGNLAGKRLAMCLDLKNEPLPASAIGMIKQMVGDDAVKGEKKYQDAFTFDEKPLLLFAGNHPVQIPSLYNEDALLTRMVVIPIIGRPAEGGEVQQLYRHFLDECAYIISEAINAVRTCIARNLKVTRTPLPEEYAPQEGRTALKSVEKFVDKMCIISPGQEVATAQLFSAYTHFDGAPPLTLTDFSRLLSSQLLEFGDAVHPLKRAAGTELRGYSGLTLRTR